MRVCEDAGVCISACVYVFMRDWLFLRTNVAILDITFILIIVNQI